MIDANDFRPSSSVESDQWLLPEEKPFTEFGQWGQGQMDNRVFEQNIWWVDINGNPHLLTEMSNEYLTNVLNHIFQNIEYFYMNALRKAAIELVTPIIAPIPNLTNEKDYSQYLESQAQIRTMTEVEWMRASPLVQKIEELLDAS